MSKVRNFLWKHLGITLDRETRIVGSIIVFGVVGVIGFGIGFAITHAAFFLLMAVLCGSVAGLLGTGGSYSPISWSLGSKKERKKIEEEIALKQWRRRARDKHYEP